MCFTYLLLMNFHNCRSPRKKKIHVSLLGGKEHILEDAKPDSIDDTTDLGLPPEMPILIDFHALKDILGPPMYEMEVSILISFSMPTGLLRGLLN